MTPTSAQDDLAFMRSLVDTTGGFQRSFGEAYFAAGLCYGLQMLLHAGQLAGWIGDGPFVGLLIGLGPTIVFLSLLTWIILRGRREPTGGGVVSRAIGALFASVGVANLALIAVIGSVAWREQNFTIWLIYPCVVLILQGMAWMVVYALRRRVWYGVVAFGWFLTGVAMALAIQSPTAFIAIGGVGFIALMLVPGWILMRRSMAA
ncbi:MAG: hypothetical protein U1C74_26210 [Phenylobacterium sp.]|nr:hypothetical protein [Phenylobacterium sp.]